MNGRFLKGELQHAVAVPGIIMYNKRINSNSSRLIRQQQKTFTPLEKAADS